MCWCYAGQMVGLTKKAEELPAHKAGITTTTAPQVTAAPHTCITLHAPLLMPSNSMCLSSSYGLFCLIRSWYRCQVFDLYSYTVSVAVHCVSCSAMYCQIT